MFLVAQMLIAGEWLLSRTCADRSRFDSLSFRYLYTLDKTAARGKSDQTLEIIMTDLDPEIMKNFYREYTSSAAEATKVCSIDRLEKENEGWARYSSRRL